MHKSVWSETEIKKFPRLEGDKKCGVLIIGGGMAGILCAYRLHNEGVDYILVEGDRIGRGVTENTTGKITFLHSRIYSKLDKEERQMYLSANKKALSEYKRLCESIDCDFEVKDAYTYSLKSRALMEREAMALCDAGVEAEFTMKTELPFKIEGAVKVPEQAQFNPMKFIKSISDNLNIYENTFVDKIDGNSAKTDKGNIEFEKAIIATHFPFINTHGSYFLKQYQHRSYVQAIENASELSGMYVDESGVGLSLRSYKNLLLIGGGGHRTGKSCGMGELDKIRAKYFKDASPEYTWATQDCMSLDSMPYIGKYSKHTPDLFTATGFNKWGMTSSMVASEVLCDLVLGRRNEFAELFNPSRSIIKPQLLANTFETTLNLLNPTMKRCTHLGCGLKWNKYEHSWDCACHGSRFTESGKVINNPAKRNIDN